MLDVNNVCDIMEMRETSIFVWMGHPGSSQGINLDTQSQYLWHERIFRNQKLIKLTKKWKDWKEERGNDLTLKQKVKFISIWRSFCLSSWIWKDFAFSRCLHQNPLHTKTNDSKGIIRIYTRTMQTLHRWNKYCKEIRLIKHTNTISVGKGNMK